MYNCVISHIVFNGPARLSCSTDRTWVMNRTFSDLQRPIEGSLYPQYPCTVQQVHSIWTMIFCYGFSKCANKGCVPALRLQKPLCDLSVCLLCSTRGKERRLVGGFFFGMKKSILTNIKHNHHSVWKVFCYIFFTVPGILYYVGYFLLK